MGVIKRGILGGFSGKVANVVGGSWKGIAYMRSLPLSVANPQSAGQVDQRNKFTGVVGFAVGILAQIIKPLWDRFAQFQSGYNAFIQANIDNFTTAGIPIYAQILISRGALLLPTFSSITGANGSPNVILVWLNNAGTGNALATDEFFGVAINETTGEGGQVSFGTARSGLTDTIVLEGNMTSGDVIHVYGAFRRADGTLVSGTEYTTFTVA